MNYKQRTKRGKKPHGIRSRNEFLRPMKKVRGKSEKYRRVVKVHSVSDVDFVMSTSFAKYRIPRTFFGLKEFREAKQHLLQDVVCYATHTPEGRDDLVLTFYWFGLDSIFDTDDFKRFKIESE